MIDEIERRLGQKIVRRFLHSANDTMDFDRGGGFWLWLAFTADYVAMTNRDRLAGEREGCVFVSKRKDASSRRLEKSFAELEFKEMNASEGMKFVVLVASRDLDAIGRFIPVRRN